jgi:hypothetical protein
MGGSAGDGDIYLGQFLGIFNRSVLDDVLRCGIRPSFRDPESPGWFRFLILTCVVASVSPEVSETGNFRERLRELLGLGSTLGNLTALPAHWKALAKWCDRQREAGKPYRRVILPDPGHMTQIGYSVRISFPSRHDLGPMRTRYAGLAGGGPLLPKTVIRAVRNDLNNVSWSDGFRAAFLDFEARYGRNERLLADHPFWIAVASVAFGEAESDHDAVHTQIEVATDIDGANAFILQTREARLLRRLSREAQRVAEIAGEVTLELTELVGILGDPSLVAGDTLLSGLRTGAERGIVPFEDASWGTWRANPKPDTARIRFLLRPDVARKWLRLDSTDWLLTDPLPRGQALDLLEDVRGKAFPISDIAVLTVSDGIRVGSSYLGRSAFLPVVNVPPGSHCILTAANAESGELECIVDPGGKISLRAGGALTGAWRLAVAEGESHDARSDILLKFVGRALEQETKDPDALPAAWEAEPEADVDENRSVSSGSLALDIAPPDPMILDLLEAVYAGCGSGWSEKDLVHVIARALGRNDPTVWDIMRLLYEGGWIEPRVSNQWRARKWYLRPPRVLQSSCGTIAMLDGAACEIVRERFTATASRLGGKVELRCLPHCFSVPVVLAKCEHAEMLALELGIPFAPLRCAVPRSGRLANFRVSRYDPDRRTIGSTWVWERRGFRKSPTTGSGTARVSLQRLIRARGDARDVYRMKAQQKPEAVFDSRCVAILSAHVENRQPLFHALEDAPLLERVALEGYLPIEIARYLVILSGVASGLRVGLEGSPRYVYPYPAQSRPDLAAWLGPALSAASNDSDLLRSTVLARHRGRYGSVLANKGKR